MASFQRIKKMRSRAGLAAPMRRLPNELRKASPMPACRVKPACLAEALRPWGMMKNLSLAALVFLETACMLLNIIFLEAP